MLDVLRIARGRVRLQPSLTRAAVILRRAAEMAQPLIAQRRHELIVEPPARPVLWWGDADRLVQVVSNLLDFGLNPQQALDAPRWQWMRGRDFTVEAGFCPAIAQQLQARGHRVDILADSTSFGRGQIIWKMDNGTLMGGTEGRTDSSIACW